MDSRTSITVDGEEITVEARELIVLGELGRGAFGVVEKMKHTPSNTVMAVKVIIYDNYSTICVNLCNICFLLYYFIVYVAEDL